MNDLFPRHLCRNLSKEEGADFCTSEVLGSTEKYTAEVPQNLMKYVKVHQCSNKFLQIFLYEDKLRRKITTGSRSIEVRRSTKKYQEAQKSARSPLNLSHLWANSTAWTRIYEAGRSQTRFDQHSSSNAIKRFSSGFPSFIQISIDDNPSQYS
jgi:hypothetical protein